MDTPLQLILFKHHESKRFADFPQRQDMLRLDNRLTEEACDLLFVIKSRHRAAVKLARRRQHHKAAAGIVDVACSEGNHDQRCCAAFCRHGADAPGPDVDRLPDSQEMP